MSDTIEIQLAERSFGVAAGTTLFALRDRLKPGADVVVYNGAVAARDFELQAGDRVVFILRGEVPAHGMSASLGALAVFGVTGALGRMAPRMSPAGRPLASRLLLDFAAPSAPGHPGGVEADCCRDGGGGLFAWASVLYGEVLLGLRDGRWAVGACCRGC